LAAGGGPVGPNARKSPETASKFPN